ncbi:hypothetical protein [Psittacicella gerlachiana]|uniref:Uncharacterized protein n=1 Tax=Psittacicella gerlachiana TaxID=2028574 RepID=A0A3A1XZW0_9GAMM|nr:hypothetical protein [Psittacicella gerlachiana]RIY31543.1 hypothetical protein CKF59_07575 [Psittacicella gerlachiana]
MLNNKQNNSKQPKLITLDYELYRQVYTAGINACPVAKAMADASFLTNNPANYYTKGVYPWANQADILASGYYMRASWFCLYIRNIQANNHKKSTTLEQELILTISDYLFFLSKYAQTSRDLRAPPLKKIKPLDKKDVYLNILFFDFKSSCSGKQLFSLFPQFNQYQLEQATQGYQYQEALALGILNLIAENKNEEEQRAENENSLVASVVKNITAKNKILAEKIKEERNTKESLEAQLLEQELREQKFLYREFLNQEFQTKEIWDHLDISPRDSNPLNCQQHQQSQDYKIKSKTRYREDSYSKNSCSKSTCNKIEFKEIKSYLLNINKYLVRFTLLGATIGLTLCCYHSLKALNQDLNYFCNLGEKNQILYDFCLTWLAQTTSLGISLQPLNDLAWQYYQSELSIDEFLHQYQTRMKTSALLIHLQTQLKQAFDFKTQP